MSQAEEERVDLKLLWREKVKVVRGSCAVTDRQAVTKGLGKIGLGCLHGIVHGFASREMGCDG